MLSDSLLFYIGGLALYSLLAWSKAPLGTARPMRILVIEDEKKVATFIKKGLEEEHYAVDTAFDGEEGLYMAEINEYDLIVLDLMIPKIDGLEVLKKDPGERKNNVPILVLTAKDTIDDTVKGFGCRM